MVATSRSAWAIARGTAGWRYSSCAVSVHGGKFGSRPWAIQWRPVRADLEVAVRVGGPLLGIGVDEPFRVAAHPRVIDRDVVRDEVEDEPDAGLPESLAQGRQAVRAAEVVGGLVGRDRVRRADDVLVGAVGEDRARCSRSLAEPRHMRRLPVPIVQTPVSQTRSNPSSAMGSMSLGRMSPSVTVGLAAPTAWRSRPAHRSGGASGGGSPRSAEVPSLVTFPRDMAHTAHQRHAAQRGSGYPTTWRDHRRRALQSSRCQRV